MEAQEVVSEPLPTTVGSLTNHSQHEISVENLHVDQKAVDSEAEERDPRLGGALAKDSLTEISSEVVEGLSRDDADSAQVSEQVGLEDTVSTVQHSANTHDTNSGTATEPVTYEDNKLYSDATLTAPTAPPSKAVSTNGLSTETSSLDTHLTNDALENEADITGSKDKDIDASSSVPAKETLVPEERRVSISQNVTAVEETASAVLKDPLMEFPEVSVINEDNTPEVALTAAMEASPAAAIPDPTTNNHNSEYAFADTAQQTVTNTEATPEVTEESVGRPTELESESQNSAEVVAEETVGLATETSDGETITETASQLPAGAGDNIAQFVAGEVATTAGDGIEQSPSDAIKTIVDEEQKLVEVASNAMNDPHAPAITEDAAFVEEVHDTADINDEDSPTAPEPSNALSVSRDATDVHAEQPVEVAILEEPILTSVDNLPSPAVSKDTITSDRSVRDTIVAELPPSGASTATEIVPEEPLHAEEKLVNVAPFPEPAIAASQSPAIGDAPASVAEELVHDDQTPDAEGIIVEIEHTPLPEIVEISGSAAASISPASEEPSVEEPAHDIPQINSAEFESSGVLPSDATVLEDLAHVEEGGAVLEEPVPTAVDGFQTPAINEEPTFLAEESALHTEMHGEDNNAGLVESPVARSEIMTSDTLNYDTGDTAVIALSNSESQVLDDGVLEESTPAESGVESASFVTDASNPMTSDAVNYNTGDAAVITLSNSESQVLDDGVLEESTPAEPGVESAPFVTDVPNPDDQTVFTGERTAEVLVAEQTQSQLISGNEQLVVEVAGALDDEENTPEDAVTITQVVEGVKVVPLHGVAAELNDDSETVNAHTLESQPLPVGEATTEALTTKDPPSQTNRDASPVVVAATPSSNTKDSIAEDDPSGVLNESQLVTDEAIILEKSTPTNTTPPDSIIVEGSNLDVLTTDSAHQPTRTEAPTEDVEKLADTEPPATSGDIEVEEASIPGRDDGTEELPAMQDSANSQDGASRENEQSLGIEVAKETAAVDPNPSSEDLSRETPEDTITGPITGPITHTLDTGEPAYHHESETESADQDSLSNHDEIVQVEQEPETHPVVSQDDGIDVTFDETTVQELSIHGAGSDSEPPANLEVVVTEDLSNSYGSKATLATVQTSEAGYSPDEIVLSSNERSTQQTEISDENAEVEASVPTYIPPPHDQETTVVNEQPGLVVGDVLPVSEAAMPPVDTIVTEEDDIEVSEVPTEIIEQQLESEPQAVRESVPVSLDDDVSSSLEIASPLPPGLSTAEKYIEADNADVPIEPCHKDRDEDTTAESVTTTTDDLTLQPPITDLFSSAAPDVTDQEIVDKTSDLLVSDVGVEPDIDATGLESPTQTETDLGTVVDLVASAQSHKGISSKGMVDTTKQGVGAELRVDDKGTEEESTSATHKPSDSRTETTAPIIAEIPDEPSSVLAQAGISSSIVDRQGEVSSTDGELAEPVLQLDGHATPVTNSIEAIPPEVVPQTSFQQTDREVSSTTLSQTPLPVTETNTALVIHDSNADISEGVEATIDRNPMQVVVESHETDSQDQNIASEMETYERQEESPLANDITQTEESFSLSAESSFLTNMSATDEVLDTTSSLLPSNIEIERPKSPWTPSYSVTTQGPGIIPEEEIETEILLKEEPPTLTVSTESGPATDSLVVEVDRPRSPWTPSYSVHVQGSPRPEDTSIEVEPSAVVRDVLTETDVLEPTADDEHEHEDQTQEPSETATVNENVFIATEPAVSDVANKVQFPGVDDTNEPRPPLKSKPSMSAINDNVEDNTVSQPLDVEVSPSSPRSRLESATSSLFFPGGWFAKIPEGRASLDNAHGEFIAAKPTPVTAQPDAAPPADARHDDTHGKKGKWCILM